MSPNQMMFALAIVIVLIMCYAIKKEIDKWDGK